MIFYVSCLSIWIENRFIEELNDSTKDMWMQSKYTPNEMMMPFVVNNSLTVAIPIPYWFKIIYLY